MNKYHKINTLFKRDMANKDKIMEGVFRDPEIESLLESGEIVGILKETWIEEESDTPVICNGLMWSEVAEDEMDWEEAMDYANKLREGGYKDWRLPTVSELHDVFDYEKGKPKIYFPTTSSHFWSSTEYSNDATIAWRVSLYHGYTATTLKTSSYAVRCVRRIKEAK